MTDSKISPEFEAYWNELIGPYFTRAEQFNCPTAEAFTIYQAARQSALAEAAKVCEEVRDGGDSFKQYEDTHDDGHMDGCNNCAAAIRSLASEQAEVVGKTQGEQK